MKTLNIFKKKIDPKDALRESKKDMADATQEIERVIAFLQTEERKLVAEIKETVEKNGNEAATRILARELVRLRQQITNLQGSRAQSRGVATHLQTLYANTLISTGMKGATKAMVAMNKEMAPEKIIKFQNQSSQLDMKTELMSESIDETLDKDKAEEEIEELANHMLAEIGVTVSIPNSKPIMSSSNNKMIVLKSSDGETFEVEEIVALESQTINQMIQDDSADTSIPLPNVTSKILSKVIEYCRKHVESNGTKADDKSAEDDLKAFDAAFVKVDEETLFSIISAAYYLNIKSLLDLTSQTVADMIKGKTPKEIRKFFNLEELSPVEEEESRRENAWAFD